MIQINCTTDPISGNDIENAHDYPSYTDKGNETELTVYFENEQNKQAFLDIPLKPPIGNLNINFDNPTDIFYDMG